MASSAASYRSGSRAATLIRAARLCCMVVLGMSLFLVPAVEATGRLRVGFYRHSYPHMERIVYNSMVALYKKDNTVAPGVLRLTFHNCFVQGCDASVLLAGPSTGRAALVNLGLHGFEAVDAAKKAVERACLGVVLAFNVQQFAAHNSVILAGGYGWPVPVGRRDGKVFNGAEANPANLPSPLMDASALLQVFRSKGLNAKQLVILSDTHTIEKAPCVAFNNCLHASPVDLTLPASFAASLKKQCPVPGLIALADLDSMPHKFDPQYFKDIIRGKGLLTSDQTLLTDSRTRSQMHANSGPAFYRNFGKAMVAMSRIGVLMGGLGEIRPVIERVN